MRLRFVALMLFALMVSASSALAQTTSVDFDKDADFSKYKTYTWAAGVPAKDPLMDQRIIDAIDAQLKANGWTKVAPDKNPDAVVLYQAAVTEDKELQVWGTGYGAGWRRGGMGTAQVDVNTIRTGQLVVDIGDASSQKLVWRGRASDTLSDKPDKNAKKIQNAVAKLFKDFPPAPKK